MKRAASTHGPSRTTLYQQTSRSFSSINFVAAIVAVVAVVAVEQHAAIAVVVRCYSCFAALAVYQNLAVSSNTRPQAAGPGFRINTKAGNTVLSPCTQRQNGKQRFPAQQLFANKLLHSSHLICKNTLFANKLQLKAINQEHRTDRILTCDLIAAQKQRCK